MKSREYIAVQEERTYLDQCFDRAVDTATKELIRDEISTLASNKNQAAETFFLSMQTSLGISVNSYEMQKLYFYVPFIAILDETGFYINYSDIIKNDSGIKKYVKRWTNRIPYSYEDNDFIYLLSLNDIITIYEKGSFLSENYGVKTLDFTMEEICSEERYAIFRERYPGNFLLQKEQFELKKQEIIIKIIEEYVNYYIYNHNNIAKEFGIQYEFTFPTTDDSEWQRTLMSSSMLILFQGYPLVSGDFSFYNRYSISGASLRKEELYYLEEKAGYYIYHNYNCESIQAIESEIACQTISECASYGAYACPICFPTSGVHFPGE